MADLSLGTRKPKNTHAPADPNGLHSIKAVVQMTGVPAHVLRLWERRLPDLLQPPRSQGGMRRYSAPCIAMVRLLDEYVRRQGMSFTGARRRIEEERAARERKGDLAYRLLNDKEVQHAIEELVWRIKARIREIVSEEGEASRPQRSRRP